MFLLNIFSRSGSQLDEEKLDKISFKIDLNDNVPKLQDWSEHAYIEDEILTPSHPLYYQIFPKEQDHFSEYTTTQNDTISGIAMKLDISEKLILSMNDISGGIYPGMKIKLPEGTDLSKLDVLPSPTKTNKRKISQILTPSSKVQQLINAKFNVYYNAGTTGSIKGSLTINSNYLIFNPSLQDQQNIQRFTVQRLLKFNAIVQTVDIQDAAYMEIPVMGDTEIPQKQSMVQFFLYRVGNTKIEKKYKERLKQLKLDHKAIASMTFTISGTFEKTAGELGLQLISKMKQIVKQIQQNGEVQQLQEKRRLTNIPFFDIIHQNIQPKVEVVEKVQTGNVINPITVLGNLVDQSAIVTNQEFAGIVKSMPVLYQLYNWVNVYGSTKDGSSFTTFLNRCNGIQPAVLLIKQHKGFKFGAFLIENIQPGKTGRGQTFIFTFRDSIVPEVYQWTGINESFAYCDKEMGVGIGMGFKYGIFIKNDLDKGSTAMTYTFGNKQLLSKKQDFYIDEVEIWTIDMSY